MFVELLYGARIIRTAPPVVLSPTRLLFENCLIPHDVPFVMLNSHTADTGSNKATLTPPLAACVSDPRSISSAITCVPLRARASHVPPPAAITASMHAFI